MSNLSTPRNFWWVNQTKTYAVESQLELLWAPHADSRGHAKSHWRSLERVQLGDVVFHYSRQAIQAVSKVTLAAREAQRPYDLLAWEALGLQIQVEFQELDQPIPISNVPLELRLAQRQKNSPFSKAGRVNVGYLFDLTADAGAELLALTDTLATDEDLTDEPEDADGIRRPFVFTQETDGRLVGKYRKEQRPLREYLLQGLADPACDICGRHLPSRFLVSAHIKPRHKCTERERRDPNVVFATCLFGCDALFEEDLIVVDSRGQIQAGKLFQPTTRELELSVSQLVGHSVPRFGAQNAKYFAWHRRSHT